VSKRLTGERRRQQIIDTAIRVFAHHGFRGTTTKSIAAAAGVSEATLYNHFRTKEELYEAILEEAIATQASLADAITTGLSLPLDQALRRIAETTLKRDHRSAMILRLLFHSALEEHSLAKKFFGRHMEGPYERLSSFLESHPEVAIDKKLDADVAARAFFGVMMYEIITKELVGNTRSSRELREDLVYRYVHVFLNGLRTCDAPSCARDPLSLPVQRERGELSSGDGSETTRRVIR